MGWRWRVGGPESVVGEEGEAGVEEEGWDQGWSEEGGLDGVVEESVWGDSEYRLARLRAYQDIAG